MLIKKLIASAMLVAACAAPAQASETISFAGGSSPTNGPDGNLLTFTNGDISVQATGWTLNGNSLETSWVGQYANGLGVTNDNEGGWSLFNRYGVDNSSGIDFILLIFNQPVTVESAVLAPVQTGWFGADNDAVVSYASLDGAFSAPPAANNPIWLDLASAAYNVSGNTNAPFLTALGSGSRMGNVWVIGAAASNPDYRSDGFQLSSVVIGSRSVPEPSTWAMMLIGFGAAGVSLRKRWAFNGRLPQMA